MSLKRVVCTGMGVVSPLGCGTNHVWENLLQSKSGVVLNERKGFEDVPSKVAAFVPTGSEPGMFSQDKIISKGESRYLTNSMIYALAATEEALHDADWHPISEKQKNYSGVAVGSGIIDLETVYKTANTFIEKGYRKISPYFVPKILTNMPAGHISIKFNLTGPNHAVSTACTTGAHAIGDAMRFIRNGDAKVMVCGGTDAAIYPISVAGFSRAKALSTSFMKSPSTSSRPFDKNRDGFVIGEGAGILILEEYEHALDRKAKIYGEILGYGLSGDGHHITAPSSNGSGARRCMAAAVRDAGLLLKDISYINAHATSTPLGDAVENMAVKTLFGDHAYKLKMSSCKGSFGHLLGAAGAVETIMTIMALHKQALPPTINISDISIDDGFDLDYIPNRVVKYCNTSRRVALKNSFGFGGTNASLCIGEV